MHNKGIKQVLEELKTTEQGLTNKEAGYRQNIYGLNEIKEEHKVHPVKIFLDQFRNPVIYILIVAALISFFILKENINGIVITAIIILNAIFGFFQEYKAERAIEALKKLASLKATVIRNNKEKEIDASLLVQGDIIFIQTGDKIPADSRLIESVNLETQEASLTGESTPVKKDIKVLPEKTAVADQSNMIFSSTIVTKGHAKAVVVKTGMTTQIGKIAKLIQEEKPKLTPLQMKLKQMGKHLSIAVVMISIIVFISGILRGNDVVEMFLAAISLAVAAIPEGLPAVVTISLALGVQRMSKRNALIRKLPSVETLGSTTVICSDKTGTLTKNEMTVTKLYVNNQVIEITGDGYDKKGLFTINKRIVKADNFSMLLKIGSLCNDAKVEEEVIGDPTEAALIVSAAKAGLDKKRLEKAHPRLDEIGFDSERKRMYTLHKISSKKTVFCKGAPDVVLDFCDRILINGKVRRLTRSLKKEILHQNKKFGDHALRVLGFAYKESNKLSENNMIFVGLQAMIDPPRQGVKEAVEKCKKAGIKVVMITGDHIDTAVAVAKEIGIEGKAITGKELKEIKHLEREVESIGIFARVNPLDKTKIVEALRKKGHIIAMTGDGINDAPAIKKAHIGISMGITGTDVAKEASDMILEDDHFTSIVNAVEEGRGTYDNIKKFFAYLISGNIGEVLIVFLGIIFGLPLPITATQILVINLVTDGLPALALSADPFEPNAMSRKPRKQDEPIYKGLKPFMLYYPLALTIMGLSVFSWFYFVKDNLIQAQTATFLTIAMFELYQAFACRSTIYPAVKVGLFKNKYLILAVLTSFLFVTASIFIPSFGRLLDMTLLSLTEFIFIVVVSSVGAIIIELSKMWNTSADVSG